MLHTRLIKKPVGRIGLTLKQEGTKVKEQISTSPLGDVFRQTEWIYKHRKFNVIERNGQVEVIACGKLTIT